MAAKQSENSPVLLSSSEEENEGSGGESEEQIDQMNITAKKLEESESEEESETDSEPEPAAKKKSSLPESSKVQRSSKKTDDKAKKKPDPASKKKSNAVTLPESSTVKHSSKQTDDKAKKKPEPVANKKSSAVTLSESSTVKRSSKQTDDKAKKKLQPSAEKKSSEVTLPESSSVKCSSKQTDDKAKKKMKMTDEEEVKKEETKQPLFQKLFSETDEINLLQGILDFTSTRAWELNAFCGYVKDFISFDVNKEQLVTKIQRLKRRFETAVKKTLKKGVSEEEIVLSTDLDQKLFEMSKKIWGDNGVLTSKSKNKKVEGSSMAKANDISGSAREMASFFKQLNADAFGLDEFAVLNGWDMVLDGPRKREMEGKLKKLRGMQVELSLQRSGLVADSANLLFKD